MRSTNFNNRALQVQPWFLILLAAYAVLELSFNHRLLDLAGDLQRSATTAQLNDIELWGRMVSGLGLALLLMRWFDGLFKSRVLLLLLSCFTGLVCMWHVQKTLVDTIVSRADEQDLLMSWHSQLSTQEALNGRMHLKGEVLLSHPAPAEIRPVMRALWASSLAGLSPEDLDSESGAAQLMSGFLAHPIPQQQLTTVYRKTVMTPVALGASLMFGLFNVCQFFAGLVALTLHLRRQEAWFKRCKFWLMPALSVLCLALSWWPGNAWTNSAAYQQVASPALWQEKPYLAPFVEWSVRAEPAWADPVAWLHSSLLQNFEFRVPFRGILGVDVSTPDTQR